MTKRTIGPIRKNLSAAGALSLALFVFFCGIPAAATAGDTLFPSFGEGKIKVRFYTDYFCPPCRDMGPTVEPVIKELIDKKTIELTFVDTPFYRYSSLYARYFLYALNEKKDLEHALYVRRSLIEAATIMIDSPEKLEAFLEKKNIPLKPLDPKPVFMVLTGYLRGDRIDATPTCVIEIDGKTSKHVGADNITGALDKLKLKKTGEMEESPRTKTGGTEK